MFKDNLNSSIIISIFKQAQFYKNKDAITKSIPICFFSIKVNTPGIRDLVPKLAMYIPYQTYVCFANRTNKSKTDFE